MSVEFLCVVTFSDRKSLHFCICFFLVERIYCLSLFVLEFLYGVSFCGDVPTLLYLFFVVIVLPRGPRFTVVKIPLKIPLKSIEIHGISTTKASFSGQILGVSWWILGKHDGRHGSLGSHGSCVGRSHGMPWTWRPWFCCGKCNRNLRPFERGLFPAPEIGLFVSIIHVPVSFGK